MSEIFKMEVESSSQSQQIEDQFASVYEENGLIKPASTPKELKEIMLRSSILPQCVRAYRTNIPGHGVALEYLPNQSEETASTEWDIADEFLQTANMEQSIEQFLADIIEDLAVCGNAYIEVARGSSLPALYRVPPENIRCTRADQDEEVEYRRLVNGKEKKIIQRKRTRRYAQKIRDKISWFREFGSKLPAHPRQRDNLGNEIIHLKFGTGVYGEPLWIGNTPNIKGDREADEVNCRYFENGRFIPIIVTVTNGELTDQAKNTLRNAKGKDTQGSILYLTAISNGAEAGESVKTQITVNKTNDIQQQDAQHLEYKRETRKQVLSCFQLPPILVGFSDDYNRATAEAALRFAEENVFRPLRKWIMDEVFNFRIFPSIGVYRVRAKLNDATTVDPLSQQAIIDMLAKNGILLVKHLVPIAERALGTVIEEDDYPDGYLDMTVSQLLQSGSVGDIEAGSTPEEAVAVIAKRLLRKAEKEAPHHV